MSEGKRYYWLRLHDDFFDSLRIKKLRRMAGGDTFTIIYLKMQLHAMKHDGILEWTGIEDNFAEELALDLDEEPENVQMTLAYLLSCGLAETEDNISFYLPYAVENTGSETASTQRSRECRERKKALQCNNNATQLQQNCSVEIEKEKDTKEIDTLRDRVCIDTHTPNYYGKYQNVYLTPEGYDAIKTECPDDWEARIEHLSEYMAATGKEYKNHLATLRYWAQEDKKNTKPAEKKNANNGASYDLDAAKKQAETGKIEYRKRNA